MTVRVYQSTDASAPTLQGIVGGAYSSGWADGSLLNLLDKCLVSGYGSKTAAGWTRSFTGTSKGVFRQGSGCQFYLRVLDDGSLTAGAKEASFYGGETASDVDTLTGLFPTAAQQAAGLKMRKSDAADTTQRAWTLYADAKTFYLFVNPGFSTAYVAGCAFGDFYSFKANDAYNCMAIGRVTSASTDALTNETLCLTSTGANVSSTIAGHYCARGYTQAGTSFLFSKAAALFLQSSAASDAPGLSTGLAVPNPEDGLLYMTRVYITDNVASPAVNVRGYLRGFWAPQHIGSSLPREYTFQGSGTLAGRTFKILGLRSGGSPNGVYTLETSDTWD